MMRRWEATENWCHDASRKSAVQQSHGIDEQSVARTLRQAEVELGVQLAVIPVDEYAALLIAGNDLQAVELLGGAAERGKFGYRGFEYPAIFHDFVEQVSFRIHRLKNGAPERFHVRHSDICAVAMTALKEPPLGKGMDGLTDAVSGNAKGLRQSPLRGELVAILEMVLGHELPEALRELLVVPGADGGRQGCLFEHLKPFLLIGKTKMADCSFPVNHFESIKPMG